MRWSSGLLIAAGFAYALYAIRVLSVLRFTTVHGDFWIIYGRLLELPFPDSVLAPYNGHSIVLPSLILLADLLVFRGSETPLSVMALALLVSIAALLVQLVLRDRRLGCAEKSLLIVTALGVTFWLTKLQILISAGFTLVHVLPIIGLLLGVRSLTSIDVADSRHPVRWWGAWAGALTATFSFGTGLAAWPVLGSIAWARRAPRRALGAWGLGMLICTLLVVRVLPLWAPGSDTAFPAISLAPLENLKYWLQLIGSPVANSWAGIAHARDSDPRVGLWFGVAGVGLAVWGLLRAWQRRRELTQAEWTGVALILFNGLAAGMIAIAKTPLFRYYPEEAFTGRYLWWTVYFWLGLIWALARSGRLRPALRANLHLLLSILFLAGIWPAHRGPFGKYRHARSGTEFIVASLASGVPVPSLFNPLLIDHRQILRLDAILRERQLSYYARNGYRSVGEPLDRWFIPRSETESAQMSPHRFFRSLLDQKKGVKISGRLTGGPADLILLTDERGVVRGLGGFITDTNPFAVAAKSTFSAFAPATEASERYQVWAVRGREARLVIPTAGTPPLD